MFDVTTGSHDGAEISDFVGLYLMHWLSTFIDKISVGLYRDSRLCAINNANGSKLDRISKGIIVLFKKEALSITIKTNLTEMDFLDVPIKLAKKNYLPFWKANNKPLYMSVFSNYPPTTMKHETVDQNDQQQNFIFIL